MGRLTKKIATLFTIAGIYFCFPATLYADSIELFLESDKYAIERIGEYHRIRMEDFVPSGSPGNPMLPYRVYNLAVPVNVNLSSLKLSIESIDAQELEGEYYIEPAPPAATWTPEHGEFIDWGRGKKIVNSRNMNVYGIDKPVLKRQVYLLPYSQMRKWKYARLAFSPFNWNPVTGKLTLTKRIQIKITYQTRKPTAQELILLRDTRFDHRAEKILHNILPARKWYKPDASGVPGGASSGEEEQEPILETISEDLEPDTSSSTADYVIITTSSIQSNSTKLDDFVTHKQNMGFMVEVVTESSYGSGSSCDQRANNIRSWLASNYASKGMEYVLLIGKPDPASFEPDTSIPMKMCYPRNSQTTYKESPSDFFYADLTGNWDIDGDNYYGEHDEDFAPGGVDRAVEVFVGRIPFYGNYVDTDSILQKIIDYESDAGDIGWRGNSLFAAGFQDDGLECDGAELMEDMWNDYIGSLTGYTRYTLYQQGTRFSGCDSIHNSDNELRGNEWGTDVNHLKYHWANTDDYGIVVWWGHGSQISTGVGPNNHPDGTLFYYTDSFGLDNNHPSIHIPISCNNGYPENADNLSYSLLKNGAICSFGPSRVTWYAVTTYYPQLGLACGDNASYAYHPLEQLLVNGMTIGEALFFCKGDFNMGWEGSSFMNATGFNLYGDPSLNNPGRGPIGTPAIEPFVGPDTDGDYTASWSAAAGANKYELQEAAYESYNLDDGAETGLGNWTYTGRWEQSNAWHHTGSYSFRCSTNNGSGGYAMTLNQGFKVTGPTGISFYYKVNYFYGVEYVKFQISNNKGVSWNDLWSFYCSTDTCNQDWTQVTADLSSYVGQDVMVRFYYGKDGSFYDGDSYPSVGVFIDDFSLTGSDILNWTTLSDNITLTDYDINGKLDGMYYYRVRSLDASSNPGWWSNTESVEVATVISVTVSPDTWNIGTIGEGSAQTGGPFTITNEGSLAEDFAIKGENGTGGWEIYDSAGPNRFMVEIDNDEDPEYDSTLITTDQTIFTNVGTGESRNFNAKYHAPSEDTKGGGLDQDFTITITASRYIIP